MRVLGFLASAFAFALLGAQPAPAQEGRAEIRLSGTLAKSCRVRNDGSQINNERAVVSVYRACNTPHNVLVVFDDRVLPPGPKKLKLTLSGRSVDLTSTSVRFSEASFIDGTRALVIDAPGVKRQDLQAILSTMRLAVEPE